MYINNIFLIKLTYKINHDAKLICCVVIFLVYEFLEILTRVFFECLKLKSNAHFRHVPSQFLISLITAFAFLT